jgi:hypothetical protein
MQPSPSEALSRMDLTTVMTSHAGMAGYGLSDKTEEALSLFNDG